MSKIIEKIQVVQKGDAVLLQKLLKQFTPLLKKYTYKLAYDEAFDDLQYCFIRLILTVDCSGFEPKDDTYILSYIRKTIYNNYIYLSKQQDKLHRSISFEDLSDSESVKLEYKTATQDTYQQIFWDEIKSNLNPHEFRILELHYKHEYSIAEIALKMNCSRQSINQSKNRALSKLRKFYGTI